VRKYIYRKSLTITKYQKVLKRDVAGRSDAANRTLLPVAPPKIRSNDFRNFLFYIAALRGRLFEDFQIGLFLPIKDVTIQKPNTFGKTIAYLKE
jgi:hypothetical protein